MKKLLVVDDEPAIREMLKDFFEDEGYAVDLAADGAEALEALRKSGPYALVLLDLIMPIMNGVQLYDTMKADPALASIPVLISTSHPTRAPAGALVIRKPVDVNILINTVKRLCQ